MPTDQNNGTNPNQNPVNDNNLGSPNNTQGNQNVDLNLEGIELDNTGLSDEGTDMTNLSADSLFATGESDTEVADANNGADDRLLQEDKAVQESETTESSVQPEPVSESSESVEQVTKSVESAVEGVEEEGVDLSGLADVLPTQTEEQVVETPAPSEVEMPVQETQVQPELDIQMQSEPLQNNESVVQDSEPVEEEGVDLSGLADVLPTQIEEQVVEDPTPADVEMPVQETQVQPELDTQTQPESLQNNESVVQNSEPVVQDNESVGNEGADLNEVADTLDTGGTNLDAPSDVHEESQDQAQKLEENGIPAESLTIENVGVPVVEDGAGNMVSDTGDFTGKGNGYVPNESEFQKMSNLLDGSKPGQVELPADVVVQTSQDGVSTSQVDNSKGVFNLDYVVSSLQDSEKKHSFASSNSVNTTDEVNISDTQVVNNAQDNVASPDTIPVENITNNDNVVPVQPMMNQTENMQSNYAQQGQGYDYQANVPMNMSQSPVQSVMTDNGTGNTGVQTPAPKAHHGPSALVILLIVICLLGAVGYILYKMYPDEVSSIFGKNNISIEYTNNETSLNLLGNDENSMFTGDAEELTGEVDLGENLLTGDMITGEYEISGDDVTDDVLDPDTLTALLQGNNEDLDDEDLEAQNTGETIKEIHGSSGASGEDIDTYKDLGLLLDEDRSDKNEVLKKLNDYKAQGIIYQDWGTENDNQGAYKYGTYIVKKTTSMIESIETTGEMDMNEIEKIFDTFDGYLSKLETLKSN